jgi:hypothetical protein
MNDRKLSTRLVRRRYGDVCDRTVDRWIERGVLPAPEYINGRRYWDERKLDAADADRKAKTGGA